MKQQGGWPRLMGCLVLTGVFLGGPGCHHVPVHEADNSLEAVPACRDLPPSCRDHVYIFLIHGTDPFDFADLHGLNAHLRELGFRKTYLGQLYHRATFTEEVRRIQKADPEARFVLIGFSLGANMIRDVAHAVKPDGTHIDLMVYLGGNTLEDVPHDRPENCGRLLNILARGCIWNGTTFPDAVNVHLPDVFHFGSPRHPHTRRLLVTELAVVASRVPHAGSAGQLPGAPLFEEPTPRPVAAPTPAASRDEWDFLKPAGLLQPPEPQFDNDGTQVMATTFGEGGGPAVAR